MRLTLLIIVAAISTLLLGCTEEQQNKLSRLGVTWLEGDYKVTSDPQKGYYYFWATENGKKVYVQTPIIRSYIEEIK